MSMVKANAAVRRGMKLLDSVAPGWWKPSKISLKRLKMDTYQSVDGCGCISGQLVEKKIRIPLQYDLGTLASDTKGYDELQVAWEREIRARREAAKAKA